MTLLNKFKNEQNRQLQIQAQLAEQSYRAFNGVKQSRENERSGELRKKMNDDLPASSLTKEMIQDYQREQEEEDFYEESHGVKFKYRPSGVKDTLVDLTFKPRETKLLGLSRGARESDLADAEDTRNKLIKERNDKLRKSEAPVRDFPVWSILIPILFKDWTISSLWANNSCKIAGLGQVLTSGIYFWIKFCKEGSIIWGICELNPNNNNGSFAAPFGFKSSGNAFWICSALTDFWPDWIAFFFNEANSVNLSWSNLAGSTIILYNYILI